MFCIKCGSNNANEAKFCAECGETLVPVEPSSTATAVASQAESPSEAPHPVTAQLPQGKPKKISVSAFTKGGRAKEAERLKAKYAKKGWTFVRFEEGGMGTTFLHFVIPASANKSTLWVFTGAVVGIFLWLVLNSTIPVLMMFVNGALAIGSVTLIFLAKHREKVFNTASKRRAIVSLVGIACLAAFGFTLAKTSRASKIEQAQEQARTAAVQAQQKADQQKQLYDQTLISVRALSDRVSTDPVAVYQEAQKALNIYSQDLLSQSQYKQLETESLALMEKTKKPFAAHWLDQAKKVIKKKELIRAKAILEDVFEIDPGLSEARTLLGKISEKAAKQEAQKFVAPILAQAKEDMVVAKKVAGAKQYVVADTLLTDTLAKLDAIPEQHRKYVNFESTRRAIERQKKRIAGPIKKQKAREEREREEVAALSARCGKKPLQSAWDGEVLAATAYVERTAHDPDSIEVKNCTVPQLTKKSCWVTTCEVRGKNAFNAMRFNRIRFTIGKHPSTEGFGQVITATNL
jgi:hypothetical protein